MNKISILNILLLCTFTPIIHAMDFEQVIPRRTASNESMLNEQVNIPMSKAMLLDAITELEQKKQALKNEDAQLKLKIVNSWDRKTTFACFAAASLAALKSGYDVYRLFEGDTEMWSNKTFLITDGIVFAGTTSVGLFHLLRSCCRKPHTE